MATGTNLANYTVVYVNGTLTVGQATLTVTAGNASRAYGVANPAFTASATGAINGDTFSFTESTTATTSSPVGTYAIVPVATGANLANYTVVYVNGTLTVGQATLTVTAGNASRAYGVANPAFSASATGAINGDTFSFTESTTATTSSPVGSYAIVPVATGTNLGNYTVVYVNGTLTVGQATLTVTAGNASRAYGVANPAFSASATGAINGDTFSFTESTTATTSSPVGTYAIVPVATGANLANYTVVYVNGTLTVGQATLTVTAGNASRAYGVANPVFSASGDRRDQRRHLQLHREHDGDDELSCRYLCDRPGGDRNEPRELHGGLRQRHPDGRPGDPDRNRRQRQPRLRGGQPGVLRQRDRRDQRRHLQLHREHDGDYRALLSVPMRSSRWPPERTSATTRWSTSTAP